MGKLTTDIVIRAKDRTRGPFNSARRNAAALEKSYAGLRNVAAGVFAFIGARSVGGFISESIEAFGQQEMAERKLADALRLVSDEAAAGFGGLKAYAAQLQTMTTIGDETTLEVMALGASLGKLSGQALKDATVASIGLSRAAGIDLTAAMRLVAKAAQGDTASLSRYGIQLDSTLDPQEKFNELLRQGAESFSIAQGEIETTAGKLQQFRNSAGDAKEEFGRGFAPAVERGAAFASDNLDSVNKSAGWLGDTVNWLIGAWEKFTGFLTFTMANWRDAMTLGFKAGQLGAITLWEEIKYTFGERIPSVLEWFGDEWKNILTTIFDFGTTVFSNMATNIFETIKNLPALISGETTFADIWTPLTEGFETSIRSLPEIAKRELTAAEKELGAEVRALSLGLVDQWNSAMFLSDSSRGQGPGMGGDQTPNAPAPSGGGRGIGLAPLFAWQSFLASGGVPGLFRRLGVDIPVGGSSTLPLAIAGGGGFGGFGGATALSARVGNLLTRQPGARGGDMELELRRLRKNSDDQSKLLGRVADALEDIERDRIVVSEG